MSVSRAAGPSSRGLFASAAASSPERAANLGATASTSLRRASHFVAEETLPPSWLLPSHMHLFNRPVQVSSQRVFSSSSTPHARTRNSQTSSTSTKELSFPRHLRNPTPYDIFHFSNRKVTPSDVKTRYYDLVRTCHPDRFTSLSSKTKTQAAEEFKSVISAYNLLKDPSKKQLYDRAGIGWGASASAAVSDPWKNFQDRRYTRRYDDSFAGAGHDRFGWQNPNFYNSHFSSSSGGRAGWKGGNGQYTSNGVFISTLFVLTWFLAGLQYSRLSLQSAKAIERADKHHLDAARSLNEARERARSQEGREQWRAFRQRARQQKFLEDVERASVAGYVVGEKGGARGVGRIEEPELASEGVAYRERPYGVGHGGPSGKQAAQERFAKAQQAQQVKQADTVL
ncbi:hypothetical protein EX895_004703 [Sporisorium graminicola]|uniref:J domain-containing protein n=1 Tax=Sporisorium graminicola TaxID=280036 RepID=A0A4U7KQA4_9BASI|nr:hypothetical protein EX895_004703 [Sporisorium graminicola]TKY86554.1 hypothetical protein EX895_004703 [Sporisorium graminicola]